MATVNKRKVPLLIDSGACANCISDTFAWKIGAKISPLPEDCQKKLILLMAKIS